MQAPFLADTGARTAPSCKRPALGGRAQFELWIFSYTVRAQPSKKWVSRVLIGLDDGAGQAEETAPSIEPLSRP